MEREEYISRIRKLLHDPDGKAWDDEELYSMLNYAVKIFCLDTSAFRGDFRFYTDDNGMCGLPRNYAGFLAGWNGEGTHIESASTDYLSRRYGNYAAVHGQAQFICEDLNTIGQARLVPNPHSLQNVEKISGISPYGIPIVPAYGTCAGQPEYGIPIAGHRFIPRGDIKYIRLAGLVEIPDPTTLIFHVVHQAYAVDGDFQNTEKSMMFLSWYRKRIARMGQMRNAPRTISRGGNFY